MPKASVSTIAARKPRPQMVSDAGVGYEVVTVTPGQAKLWLGSNTDNRRLRGAHAGRFGRDMASGNWRENGSAIVFAKDGTLIDGQHRLEGCVDSGAPFTTLVVRNVERGVQNTIDDGVKRTLGDRFTFEGRPNANVSAAVVRRILLWQQGFRTNTGNYQPSTAEAFELLANDPTAVLAIEATTSLRMNKLLPPSIIGLGWWLFWDLDADDCQEFWDGLHSGAGLQEGSPILAVRNQIIRKSADPGRIPETVILAWVIKAWNAYRAGRTAYRFNLRAGEKFPEPK